MRLGNQTSLWTAIEDIGLTDSAFCGAAARVELRDLMHGSALNGQAAELRGRSVLIATTDQLTAALALIELDGIVRRLVLCPADVPVAHLPFVMEAGEVDAIVSDRSSLSADLPPVQRFLTCDEQIVAVTPDRRVSHPTEWILLTSGTTGLPKLVLHTLASLAGAIGPAAVSPDPVVWGTFYDIRRYGGLQIFLRAVLSGASLVLSSAKEPTANYLSRAGACGVTHISGTPSHWRHALMSPAADRIAPQYVRLSGEIADQGILNQLHAVYPHARIGHAFASTEAGVAFDVNDGLAGFPVSVFERPGVEMKVEDGSLRIRSSRTAPRYIGQGAKTLRDADGFVDTGDMVELRGDRYYFVGRRDGVINVGGLKVHPEEVESVINRHPRVQMSLVHTRKNPITGALVVADVVLDRSEPTDGLRQEIIRLCRDTLARHKVPATINFVAALTVAETGKLARQHA